MRPALFGTKGKQNQRKEGREEGKKKGGREVNYRPISLMNTDTNLPIKMLVY